ncbi:MAG: hypothetical protein J6Y94_03715, partial [Bacteriovoracaceae bacterium]|nr:hypothetical protein [Bacteriovoracaceae bacterium]
SIIEQRQVESFTEQLRLTNFLSVMLGRSCHYREAIKFMLDYLLNQYHVSSFTPAAEHAQEEFLAKALGATLCDYYTHVKMERLELFQESMTVLLNSARPEYRFIGLYLITANADQRTANRDLFSMVLRPNWLKTYLLSDSKLAFPPLERLLTFGQRLYFAELSDLYQTLAVDRQIQKKLPTLFTHPFVGLKPHRLLEICNLDPSFNIGQALSKNKLNKEVPFRLAHQDLARAPETLAWLHLQDETWFNGPQVRQNIKEYFDKLFTHLISHAQNDELDVVKLNFTHSDWRLRTFMAAKFALVIHGLPEILEKDLTLQLIAHTQTLPEGVAKDAYATAVAHLLAHVHDPHWYFSQPPIIEFIDYLLAHQDTTMQALGLAPLWAQDDPRFNNHAFRLVGQKSWLQHFMHLDSSRHSLNTRWSILLNSLLVSEDDEATLLFEVALTTLLEQHLAEVEQGQSTKAPRRPKSVRFKDLVKEDICTAYLQPPSSAASAAAQISN